MASTSSNALVNYSFLHEANFNSNNYYRLRMVDLDGSFTFSTVVKYVLALNGVMGIYPNPVTNQLIITYSFLKGDEVSVFDLAGRKLIVQKITAGMQQLKLNVSSLPKGVYIVQILQGHKNAQHTFVKE